MCLFQAANLLKRTEGLVSLVVSNPGKKSDNHSASIGNDKNSITPVSNTAISTTSSTLKPSKTPSRPTTPVPGKFPRLTFYLQPNVIKLIVAFSNFRIASARERGNTFSVHSNRALSERNKKTTQV